LREDIKMLFLIDIDIDYARLGDKLDQLLEEESKISKNLFESGINLAIWRKANAKGVVVIADHPSHESLYQTLKGMPLYSYFTDIRVTPLVTHPKYPQFGKPRERLSSSSRR
jgi:muconolactone delta-isomerase